MKKININENVYVFLTDSGKQILENEAAWNLKTPKYNEETGLYCEQLWVLMTIFGPHLWLGMPGSVFKDGIIYLEKPKTYFDDEDCKNCKEFQSHSDKFPESENKKRNPENCFRYLGNTIHCPRIVERLKEEL